MAKYRKKPVVIDAIQFSDSADVISAISDFAGKEIRVDYALDPPVLKIDTLEGTMVADVGDWIIKGVQGEFYPCKPDIFEATYEIVERDNDQKEKVINVVDTRDRLIASISEGFIILDNNYRVIKTNEDDACFANENDEMFVLRTE